MKSVWFRGIETEVTLHGGFICEKKEFLQKVSHSSDFYSNGRAWKEGKMLWTVEFLDKKDAICYTGISMWKESYKNEEIFCNPWASHFGIDWLFAIPNEENYNR